MAGSTGHPPRPRRRVALAGAAGFALGLAWAWLAAISPPLAIGCDPAIPRPICEDTADAGLRRGMPNLRPLIVRADVVPGPVWPDGYGHKATVTYTLLPGPPVVERLYFDAGAHWGAVPDRGDLELALWSLIPAVVLGGAGSAGAAIVLRRRAVPAGQG